MINEKKISKKPNLAELAAHREKAAQELWLAMKMPTATEFASRVSAYPVRTYKQSTEI
jgi:hypothetical protein